MRQYLLLTTLDPLVLSESNGSTSNHHGLDFIPGNTLLGAVAAKLYPTMDKDQSWQVFHSGKVRFGNAYPVVAGEVALPIPACWHAPKGEPVFVPRGEGASGLGEHLSNHACASFNRAETVQYQQCRAGYVTASGHQGRVSRQVVTKTALDRNTGRAKEGQLFNYTQLDAEQQFIGWVEADDAAALEPVLAAITGTQRLGRSRNSEFGRVSVSLLNTQVQSAPKGLGQQLVIWCLSDLECLDSQGTPSLLPDLSLLAGIDGELDARRSFIRSRRLSRFNQKRAGLDSEQVLISKGSVLVYQLAQPLTDQALLALQTQGLGLNRQQGQGWIMVNPEWAASVHLDNAGLFAAPDVAEQVAALSLPQVAPADSPLVAWVSAKLAEDQSAIASNRTVSQLQRHLLQAYWNARHFNNISPRHQAGPTASQWRLVMGVLRTQATQWKAALFDPKKGICDPSKDEYCWGIKWFSEGRMVSFAEVVQALFEGHEPADLLLLLENLSRYDLSTSQDLKLAQPELAAVEAQQAATEGEQV